MDIYLAPPLSTLYEKFENINGVTRSRESKKTNNRLMGKKKRAKPQNTAQENKIEKLDLNKISPKY